MGIADIEIIETSAVAVYDFKLNIKPGSGKSAAIADINSLPVRNIALDSLGDLLCDGPEHLMESWIQHSIVDDTISGGVTFTNNVTINFDVDKVVIAQKEISLDPPLKKPDFQRFSKVLFDRLEKNIQANALGINFTAQIRMEDPDAFMKRSISLGEELDGKMSTGEIKLVCNKGGSQEHSMNITLMPVIVREGDDEFNALGIRCNFHHGGEVFKRVGYEGVIGNISLYRSEFLEAIGGVYIK